MKSNFKIFNCVNKKTKEYYIGFCRCNVKQHANRVLSRKGKKYEDFIVKQVDSAMIEEEAIEVTIANIVWGKIYLSDWHNINKRYEKEANDRANEILESVANTSHLDRLPADVVFEGKEVK